MFSSNRVYARCVFLLRTKKVVTGRRRRLVKLPATSTLCVRNSIKRFNDFLIFIENSASMCGPNATQEEKKKQYGNGLWPIKEAACARGTHIRIRMLN